MRETLHARSFRERRPEGFARAITSMPPMTSHATRKLEHRRTAGLSLKQIAKLILRWRRLGSSPARRVAHAIVLMLALLFCCCKSRAEGAQPRAERTQIARGDRVVVE